MEPISTAIATKAGADISEVTKRGAETFITAVLREPGEALGGLFADKIRERRHANLIRIAARARERLANAGVSPKAVPLSIIHPALEAASLEEDSDLQDIWANLLANAADPRQDDAVLPSFPGILKEFTSREVKLLNALYERAREKLVSPIKRSDLERVTLSENDLVTAFSNAGLAQCSVFATASYYDRESHKAEIAADNRDLSLSMDVVKRQELISETISMRKKEEHIRGSSSGISYSIPRDTYWLETTYSLTRFGVCFVTACRPPFRSEAPDNRAKE